MKSSPRSRRAGWLSRILALGLAACLWAEPAAASSRPQLESAFRAWLGGQVWRDAQAKGVSRAVFDRAFEGVTLDWSLPDLEPPGAPRASEPQRQPEFRSPGAYFAENGIARLVGTGRGLLARYAAMLDAVERRYGVPRAIVVAIWGRESGFGRVAMPHSAIRALSTEAFMGRRKAFFYPELIAALQILQEGHVPPAALRSSWAGAMGQPQFLPSKFLAHAVDFDGDGRRDIWGSVPDSLASIASFLKGHGWRAGLAWGEEVTAPPALSCTLEGPDKGRPRREWERLGIRTIGGAPLGRGDEKGHLLMPAGRFGPAFLVSENFYVLKKYNESDLYALFIGHVADRFRQDAPFKGRWNPVEDLLRSDIAAMQKALEAKGHDVGGADGLVGFATRVAVGRWQAAQGSRETCFPSADLVARVLGR